MGEDNIIKDKIEIDNELLLCKRTWERKKILRRIYHQWYSDISVHLKDGITFEVCSGIGSFKEFYPKCITSDIRFSPWVDLVADAMQLPIKNESITNLVCVDGLHHLEKPYLFLSEAQRVLKRGVRLILFEPYLSPFAYLIRKLFHHEDINYSEFSTSKTPLEANLAIPTVIFCKNFGKFQKNFPGLKLTHKSFRDLFLYPLSGGFHRKSLIPYWCYNPMHFLERKILKHLNRFFAFKIFLVFEKIGEAHE